MLAVLALWLANAWARAGEPGSPSGAQSAAVATRRALIVCGLPGDDEHRKLFAETVEKLQKALTERYGFAASEVLVRFGLEKLSGDGPALAGARGISNREGIVADVDELRKRLGTEDTLWVIVLGHAHYDGRHSFLNIPGPDLDERAFAKLFAGLKAREQVFFLTTPASGFFIKPLATPGRIVITATEPDREVNETLFPLALADVLAVPPEGIDRDKDGKISVLELYLAVVSNVMKRYADAEDLPTEHAKLDDNHDGHGSELQEYYLPKELGGHAGKAREPKFGPKDDGGLASKMWINVPVVPKP
ncbi:MAG TPA: hypothetical protein VG815_16255 [Chloroflexota bacterium]|nr:hypothetical protein [Chloroflexota bacterium]